MKKLWLVYGAVALLFLCSASLFASDKKDAGLQSSVNFVILKDDTGKPVRNAAVVLHPVSGKGKQAKGGIELKTDNEGKTHFDGIPFGTLRVQALAPGFQTFGDDFTINQANQDITIRLKRPQGQYSIYENHDGSAATSSSGSQPPK